MKASGRSFKILKTGTHIAYFCNLNTCLTLMHVSIRYIFFEYGMLVCFNIFSLNLHFNVYWLNQVDMFACIVCLLFHVHLASTLALRKVTDNYFHT